MPGSAKFAEWCYGSPVNLLYHGRVIKSSKGHQGCPLMMPMYCAMNKEMRDEIEGVKDLDLVAEFADDGVDGGDYQKVLHVLQKELSIGPAYGSILNPSKMKVYVLAGDGFEGDLQGFKDLGVEVGFSGNVEFMKVPIAGSKVFLSEWCDKKRNDIKKGFCGNPTTEKQARCALLVEGGG